MESKLVLSSGRFDKKCGDITFCINAEKRIYALSCLFCQQVCLQWDTFIDHMEVKHCEELNFESMLISEDYESVIPKNITPILKLQNKLHPAVNYTKNVDDNTNQSLLGDPLEKTEFTPKFENDQKMDTSNSNCPVLNEDLYDDITIKDEFLCDEISLKSSLYFENDERLKETIVYNEKQLTDLVIQYYQQHTILWQTNSKDYKNIRKRNKAYTDITDLINKELDLNFSCMEIKEKINKLKRRFRRENELINEFSIKSSSTCGNNKTEYEDLSTTPNKTQLEQSFYEKMSFLKDYINADSKKQSKQLSTSLTNEPLAAFSLEENKKLIELYKSYPCLWDVNNIEYRFKNQRQENLQEFLEAVNTQFNIYCSIENLQKKLYSLRNTFTQEKQRQIKDKHNFTPQCKLYNELLFLEDSVGPFQCEYCEQIFNGADQYTVHKSSHDGSMPYICPECKKGFMSVGNWIVHLRRHKKAFKFECGECEKKFVTSTDYHAHLRAHTGEKPYFCHICGQSYRTWTRFNDHKRRHEKNKIHKCSICSKGFYQTTRLKEHMNMHLNVRDKVCNVCGKSFTSTRHLNQHKLTHAEVKKYSCKLCGKKFAQPGGLTNHTKSHGMIGNSSITLTNSEYTEEKNNIS